MSPKKKKSRRTCRGEFVWAVDGKTQHPARLVVPRNEDEAAITRHSEVEVMWTNTGKFEWIEQEDIIYEEDEATKISRRGQTDDEEERSSRLRARKQKMIENQLSPPKTLYRKRGKPGSSARKRRPAETQDQTSSAKKRKSETKVDSVVLESRPLIGQTLDSNASKPKASLPEENNTSVISNSAGILGSLSAASGTVVSGFLGFLGLSGSSSST
jgi:hypothetical protein